MSQNVKDVKDVSLRTAAPTAAPLRYDELLRRAACGESIVIVCCSAACLHKEFREFEDRWYRMRPAFGGPSSISLPARVIKFKQARLVDGQLMFIRNQDVEQRLRGMRPDEVLYI